MRGSAITPTLKKAIWDLYIGVNVSQTQCPLCGLNTIYLNRNSGFEAAHIVAAKFDLNNPLTPLHLYPSCKPCNNACSDMCLLDYLWCRDRVVQLRSIIWSIYKAFVAKWAQELEEVELQAWKVLRHLYGSQKYPAGGGLQNEKQIYEEARMLEYVELAKTGAELNRKVQENAKQMEQLLSARVTVVGYKQYMN